MDRTAPSLAICARTPGRTRYRVRGLYHNHAVAAELQRQVDLMAGVSRVCANPATGTLLVLSALELSPEALEATLAATLHQAVAAPIARQSPRWPQRMRTTLTDGLLSAARVLRSNGASLQPSVKVEVFGPAHPTRLAADAASNHTTSRPPASADSQPLWHRLELDRILGVLGVHGSHGLSTQEAAARLATDGANVLLAARRRAAVSCASYLIN